LYRERYTSIEQRTSRHKLFTPTVIVGSAGHDDSGAAPEKKYQLKTIDYLLVFVNSLQAVGTV
jgi:hypothetical protein